MTSSYPPSFTPRPPLIHTPQQLNVLTVNLTPHNATCQPHACSARFMLSLGHAHYHLLLLLRAIFFQTALQYQLVFTVPSRTRGSKCTAGSIQ